MKWQRWGLAMVPVAAGLVIASLFLGIPTLTSPILSARVDLGTLAVLIGAVLSLLAAGGLALWEWSARRCQQQMADGRTQAVEERRRFLQRLDHELKNPLTAIRAGLANLANGSDEASRAEALASVELQVLRLSRLTADLRKLAELEARPLERAPVDVAELLQEVVS